MFAKATHRLIHQIDREGVLIAVSRLNDSEKLKPLAVVIKRPAAWFWQRTKYRPTAFTLNHLLQGDHIEPVLEKTEFIHYKENLESIFSGSLEAGIVGVNLAAKGQGASRLSASLGTLHKEKVNLPRLLKDSSGRMVDPENSLIKQACGKSQQTFTVVLERIFTTCECTIAYSGVDEGSCSAILRTFGFYPAEISLQEINSLQFGSDVAIEIPPDTVLAYSVITMDIKNDGSYELSAWPDGFESDNTTSKLPHQCENEVDGLMTLPEIHEESLLSAMKEALSGVKASFCALADLPAQSRASLLLLFRKILLKRSLLSTLEDKLDELCFMLQVGETSCISQDDVSNELIKSFLELLQSPRTVTIKPSTTHHNQNGSLPSFVHRNGVLPPPADKNGAHCNGMTVPAFLSDTKMKDQNGSHLNQSSKNGASIKSVKQSRSVFTAMHMLVSAAEGLTDDGLILLESLCTSEELDALNVLVDLLTDDSQPLSINRLPTPLQNNDVFFKVEKLFSSSNIQLKRENKRIWMEGESSSIHLPLVLCVVISGLAHLSEALK